MNRLIRVTDLRVLFSMGTVLLAVVLLLPSLTLGGPPGAHVNGDVNGDGNIDIADAIYLLSHLFSGGPPPVAIEKGQRAGIGLNILAKWKEGVDAGQPGYTASDASQAFVDAWQEGELTLYLPEVPDDGVHPVHIGHYPVKDLEPPTGARLLCEGLGTVVTGVTASDSIFLIAAAPRRVHIEGGTWRDCHAVVSQTPEGRIHSWTFDGLYVPSATRAFDLLTATGTVWHRVIIDGGPNPPSSNVDYGVYVGGDADDGNFFNTNRFSSCVFVNINQAAIHCEDSTAVKQSNAIDGECWFEHIGGSAVVLSGGCRMWRITNSYFANCGDADPAQPDILLTRTLTPGISPLREIVIDACFFGEPNDDPVRRRIRTFGACSAKIADNYFFMRDGQVCVAIETTGRQFQLLNNNIQYGGALLEYESVLYEVLGGADPNITWTNYVGSAGVIGDDEPARIEVGRTVGAVESFEPAGAVQSVESGHLFLVPAAIPRRPLDTLTDGKDGQIIQLVVSGTGTFEVSSTAGNLQLAGGTTFTMSPGDTLSLVFIDAGGGSLWHELGRSVN